jgi:hypothetical protein
MAGRSLPVEKSVFLNEVYNNFKILWAIAKELRNRYGESTIFSRAIFIRLVEAATRLAIAAGYIKK